MSYEREDGSTTDRFENTRTEADALRWTLRPLRTKRNQQTPMAATMIWTFLWMFSTQSKPTESLRKHSPTKSTNCAASWTPQC